MRALRWAVAVVLATVLGAVAALYGISEWKMRRQYEAPLLPLTTAGPADPVAGEHLSKLVGCWAGCHGDEGEGGVERIEGLFSNTAPTLSPVLARYSDAELVRVIRYGVKQDGRSAIGMTSYAFWALSDQDLADIIAHLRRQPVLPPVPRHLELTLKSRIALVTGEWKVSAAQVDRSMPRWGELPRTNAFERGRYLATIVCAECHGLDFDGYDLEGAPSLAILANYTREDFRRLLRTGKAVGDRAIPQMDWMPDVDFTDTEIDELETFLRAHHGLATVDAAAEP